MAVDEGPRLVAPLLAGGQHGVAGLHGTVGQDDQVQDHPGHRLGPVVVSGLVDMGPQVGQERRKHGAGPAIALHRRAQEQVDIAQPFRQPRPRNPQAQHMVGFGEADRIGQGGVAEGEVASLQHRLSPGLAVHATAGVRQVQQHRPVPARLPGRPAHGADAGGCGVRSGEAQFAERQPHQLGLEARAVIGVDDHVVQSPAGEVVPERQPGQRRDLGGRIALDRNGRHALLPPPRRPPVVDMFRLGPGDYFVKPVERVDILENVPRLLKRRAPFQLRHKSMKY